MKHSWTLPYVAIVVTLAFTGCATKPDSSTTGTAPLARELRTLKERFAPDSHLAVYTVGAQTTRNSLILTGEVDHAEARIASSQAAERLGLKVTDEIRVLPAAELGETNWGITALSVANGREGDEHKAELGTQTLMGEPVRVLKRQGRWLLVQSHDKYISWMEAGSVNLCTRAEVEKWEQSPLLIVTNLDGLIRQSPEPDAQPISDVVIGCRVKKVAEAGDWFKVELPDGRSGFLARDAADDYASWKQSRQATPENIEQVAKQFIGRPYLWGANTPRGLDCSGFTKLVFMLNGVELSRNASQQAHMGVDVPLGDDLSHLKKGDLLFFGTERRGERGGRVTHTGIYLGNKLFIQSSQRVRLSSLNPESPIRDEARIRGLIKARRVLPEK